MSDRHEHPHRDADAAERRPAIAAAVQDDAGSRALSDALRSSFFIVKFLMAGLILLFFGSGFFVVGPQERAVKLQFGKPVGEGAAALLGPGAHWAWPYPIDEVVRIPFSQVQEASSTIGWYAVTPEQQATRTEPPPRETLNPAADGYVLTGDANIIHVRATLRYRIADPLSFIFSYTNTPEMITNALDSALYFAAAQFSVDDVLTRNQVVFRERIERRINDVSTRQRLGIEVENVLLSATIPPRQLAERFRAALEASVRSERMINEARSYANESLSRAQGEAATRLGRAQSDRARLVEAVSAEAKRFSDVLPTYRENPELFRRLWLAETVQRVFTNAQERIFLPARADGKSRTLRLDLSREPLKPPPAPAANSGQQDRH
jgi:membrane protease subunit HflK